MEITPKYEIRQPVYSDWQCHLFGAKPGEGLAWIPEEGNVPNWFHRFMQRLCFGNRWVRISAPDA